MSVTVRTPQREGDEGDGHLDVGATVATVADGRRSATVRLRGELCAAAVPGLRAAIDRLVADGVTDLLIDLRDLRLCTSAGLDVWDDADRRLRASGGGVRLVEARGVVGRVLAVIRQGDPTFGPEVVDGTA